MDHENTFTSPVRPSRTGLIAQVQDSIAVAVLWLVGLWILKVPWAPLWALAGGPLADHSTPRAGP